MARSVLAAVAVLLCLVAATFVTPSVAQTADLVALNANIAQLNQEERALDTAIERQQASNSALLAELDATATMDTSLTALREAQSDVDIARARLVTLNSRVSEQQRRLNDQDEFLRSAAARYTGPATTLRGLVGDVELGLRAQQRAQSARLLERLEQYRSLSDDFLSLRRERLLIVQQGIALSAVDGSDQARNAPVAIRLQLLIDRLARAALDLANEASSLTPGTEAGRAERELLRLRSDEALLRSNARYTDLALWEATSVRKALALLVAETGVPIRLYDDALEALAERRDELRARSTATAGGANALADLQRIARQQTARSNRAAVAAGQADLEARLRDLSRLLEWQTAELSVAETELAAVATELDRARSDREREGLFVRTEVRTDELARARLASEVQSLPDQLRQIYSQRWNEVKAAFQLGSNRDRLVFVAGLLAIFGAAVLLRQKILLRFVKSKATVATEIPLEVLRRNLFWLLPAAVWALYCARCDVGATTEFSIYPLLLTPAAGALVRDLTQVIVARRSEGDQRKIGVAITRLTEIATVGTAVVLVAYVVLQETALLPSTQGAINRIAYSVFVLSGLPMLLFVFFFAASGGGLARLQNLASAGLSLLAPTALIVTGVTGLAGYSNLAAIMLVDLGVAVAIIAIAALVLGIIHDGINSIALKIRESDPERAYFVQTNALRPAERILQALLIFVAVAVAARIYRWSNETPLLREVIAFWNMTVFTASDTNYTVGSIVFAILALALVFWVGAWSRRIAYSVVFGRLRDVGIRQSLSVFAQYVVIVLGVLLTLSAIGFDVTTLTVFAASLGVGIGFGLQNVVNNFISGLLLLVERPLRVGDIVTVGTDSGTVTQIGIRSMRMRTFDEFDLIVPNSALISDTFTNWTRSNSLMRVILPVGIGYDDNPSEAVQVVLRVLREHPGVVKAPPPMVTVDEFADSSVNLRVCYYIDLRATMSGFVIRSEVLTGIWEAFRAAGITIPYPQRDVHFAPQSAPAIAPPSQRPLDPREPVNTDDGDWAADAIEETIEMARSND